MDLRSTPLSYIFNALFRDTPLGHVYITQPNSQNIQICGYLAIWLFGCAQKTIPEWGIREKSIKNVAQGR